METARQAWNGKVGDKWEHLMQYHLFITLKLLHVQRVWSHANLE